MTTSNDESNDSTVRRSVLEVADSVTGFEEQEVTQHFERPLADLQFVDSAMWARALVFVTKRREKVVDIDAYAAVMAMTIKDVWAFFEHESPESGKDDSSTETQLESSQPSAS